MTLDIFLFILGFAILIKGADWLVDGASALAKRLSVSALFIGLTIVAFGTSMPELAVNIFASLEGKADIAVGNILGSNIFNILFILGISAVIYPLILTRGTVWKEIPFALLAVIAVAFMANDARVDNLPFSMLTRIDGLLLLAFFTIFLYYAFLNRHNHGAEEPQIKGLPLWTSICMILGGLAALVLGGKWIVDGAVTIARNLGVTEALIGLTIVAVGTSLPELATSAVAAYKKRSDIAVGNIVGSNIFNIFFILGVSAIIRPLPFSEALINDIFVALGATALLFFSMFAGKKNVLERWQGIGFILLYAIYIVYLIQRG